MPLSDDEVKRMRLETKIDVVDFEIGDKIQIVSGPLDGFEGVILDLNLTSQKAKVKVAMFNTETEVDVDFVQLKSLK